MEILPLGAGTTIVASALSVVTANIVPVLTVLGFAWGVKFFRKFANASTNGRI